MSYVNGYKDYSKLVNDKNYPIEGPILRKQEPNLLTKKLKIAIILITFVEENRPYN